MLICDQHTSPGLTQQRVRCLDILLAQLRCGTLIFGPANNKLILCDSCIQKHNMLHIGDCDQQALIYAKQPPNTKARQHNLTHQHFAPCCRANARHWVYPATVPEREYQVDIIKTALLQNTLVCLPTGLGKTLIAAVLMYNFTRWFPEVLLHVYPAMTVHMLSCRLGCSSSVSRSLLMPSLV